MKIICDWENCSELGKYKAPTEKDNSRKYKLLCLKHIKIFNKNWNYFENMNDQEIEYFLKSDMTWHKKTQSFSSSDNFFKVLWNNVLNDGIEKTSLRDKFIKDNKINFNHNDIKAFSILGVKVGLKWDKIQEKFKKLVKKFHPDINAGDKSFEEKLKIITLAYTQLKNTYREKIGK